MVQINIPQYGNVFFNGDTFADLRSIPATRIEDGYSAIVKGGAVPADGFGGMYVWSASSMVEDDGYNTIAPADGVIGRWLRIAVGQVGPVGPKGDASTVPGPQGPAGTVLNQSPFAPAVYVGLDKFMQQNGAFPEAFDSNIDARDGDAGFDAIPAIKAACDFAVAHNTKVILKPGRHYFAHQQLRLKSGTIIDGQTGGMQPVAKTFIQWVCDGSMLDGSYAVVGDGANYAADRVILRGLWLRPVSSNTNNKFGGVCMSGFGQQLIECDIDNFGIEGVVLAGGDQKVFSSNIAGMQQPEYAYGGNDPFDLTGSNKTPGNRGSLAIYGGDGQIFGGEISGCGRLVDANKMSLASLKIVGSTMDIYGCRVQTGECGQREFGFTNRYTGVSWDTNFGHGMVLDGSGRNVFTNCTTGRSSGASSGTYDHIHNLTGAYNTIINHLFYNDSFGTARYDIYDARDDGGSLSNSYLVGNHSGSPKINPAFGGHYISRDTRFNDLTGDGASILGLDSLRCNDATTFHYFSDVIPGQRLTIVGNGSAKLNRFKPSTAPAGSSSFDFLFDLGLDEITLKADVLYEFIVGRDRQFQFLGATDRAGRSVSIVPPTQSSTTSTTTTSSGTNPTT